ncbi:hypothetical protein B5X24_HaOG206394 [Helicoverpa armigera]|nr:hypothetical protein B5X24_HaOG206394 [Helicoverpa armigera]
MFCDSCNNAISDGDLIECIACKTGYHRACLNTMEKQLEKGFKCGSCANVTHRLRVTDDTPVRGMFTGTGITNVKNVKKANREEIGIQLIKDSSSSKLSDNIDSRMESIMEMVKGVISNKFKILEANLLQEIQTSVTNLALENSRLNQELIVANKKCISLEEEIKMLKTVNQGQVKEKAIANPIHQQPSGKVSSKMSPSISTSVFKQSNPAPAPAADARAPSPAPPAREPPPPQPSASYAAVASVATNTAGTRDSTDLSEWTESSGSDIFAITETGCSESMHNAEISLPGYPILRCDRADGRKQGGVLLVATPRFELRQLDLVLSGRGGVSVRAADEGLQPVDAYHPPLDVSIGAAAATLPAHPAPLAPAATPERSGDTHQIQNHNNIYFKQWNFNKADFFQMYSLLNDIDWSDLYALNDIDLALNFFYKNVEEVFDSCVPLKKKQLKNNNRYKYPVWYTSDIISSIQLKYNLHKRYKASKSVTDYEAFSLCRARVKTETKLAHDRYRDRVQNHLAKDPKAFWNYVRSKKGTSNKYKLVKDGLVLTDKEGAEEFAQFFHSVYSPKPATLDVNAASATASQCAARAQLDRLDKAAVYRSLARLPAKRSVGPDGIPPFILRDCRDVFCEPLLHIFNICISSSTFPERWKLTRVVPVPKGSGGTEASDYRPVAVLSSPAKVFEAAKAI